MPAIASLLHSAAVFLSAFSFAQLVRALFGLLTLTGFVMFFRPLLTGIVRALVLTVRPRLAKDELAARRALRDTRVLQRAIETSDNPVDAVALRALAARA